MTYTLKAHSGAKVMADEEHTEIEDARARGMLFACSEEQQDGIYEIYSDGKPVESVAWVAKVKRFEPRDPREWF